MILLFALRIKFPFAGSAQIVNQSVCTNLMAGDFLLLEASLFNCLSSFEERYPPLLVVHPTGLGGFRGGGGGQSKPGKFWHSWGRTADLGPVLKIRSLKPIALHI